MEEIPDETIIIIVLIIIPLKVQHLQCLSCLILSVTHAFVLRCLKPINGSLQ